VTTAETTHPSPSRPVDTRPPARPGGSPPPAPPRPSRLHADVWFRQAVAVIAVGVLLLTTHYFAPFLLLAALPTKQWRAAA